MTTKKLSTVLLTGTFALSACQILPEFSKPAAPIPEKFPVTMTPEAAAVPVAEVGWRDFFSIRASSKRLQQRLPIIVT